MRNLHKSWTDEEDPRVLDMTRAKRASASVAPLRRSVPAVRNRLKELRAPSLVLVACVSCGAIIYQLFE
jgi:hypothetical protein